MAPIRTALNRAGGRRLSHVLAVCFVFVLLFFVFFNVHIQNKLFIAHACHGHTLQLSTALSV